MNIVDLDGPDVVVGGTGWGLLVVVDGGLTSWKDRPSNTRPYLPLFSAALMI